MQKVLPEVKSVSELNKHENGAFFRLGPRQSLHDFKAPKWRSGTCGLRGQLLQE